MKIAIATEGNNVSGHFGKCENFTLVDIENSKVKDKNTINTAGNQHGLLPAFLASHGANVVIAGGMGDGAKQKLTSQNIEIISGVTGRVEEVIDEYLSGSLKSTGAGCSGHEHSHDHSHGEGGCSCGHN
jgi:predicted Fe-Mo cluster-binding NifX family protein